MTLSALRNGDPSLPALLLSDNTIGVKAATDDWEKRENQYSRWAVLPLSLDRGRLLLELLGRFAELRMQVPTLSRIRLGDPHPGAVVEISDDDLKSELRADEQVQIRFALGILLVRIGQVPMWREWLHPLFLEVEEAGFRWATEPWVAEPFCSAMLPIAELVAPYFLTVPENQLGREFRVLAAEDPYSALSLLERGIHVDAGGDMQIGQFLKAEDLSALLESKDPSVREKAISLLGRTGR